MPPSKPAKPEWVPAEPADGTFATEVMPGIPGGAAAPVAGTPPPRKAISAEEAVAGVLGGQRVLLARAITMIESRAPAHREAASEILRRCLPHSGRSVRVGITGVPGAGKSTFIEALGMRLCADGHRVAVLAVDPSSSIHGGSVLGDKTRMEELSRHPLAFIRPSPSSGTLGGVAAKTRESMLLCEAAGFDVIIVETVGVGQSEVAVRTMVDFFLLLQIAGAGDELQGIKKGVIEMADAIVVNKADGDNLRRAELARAEYNRVLHYLHPFTPGWTPRAISCSALAGTGVAEVWSLIVGFREQLQEAGLWESRRREQNVQWFESLLREAVLAGFFAQPGVRDRLADLEKAVGSAQMPVAQAVDAMLGKAEDESEATGYLS